MLRPVTSLAEGSLPGKVYLMRKSLQGDAPVISHDQLPKARQTVMLILASSRQRFKRSEPFIVPLKICEYSEYKRSTLSVS